MIIRFCLRLFFVCFGKSHCFTKSVLEMGQGEVYIYCPVCCPTLEVHYLFPFICWMFGLFSSIYVWEEERRVEDTKCTINFECKTVGNKYVGKEIIICSKLTLQHLMAVMK